MSDEAYAKAMAELLPRLLKPHVELKVGNVITTESGFFMDCYGVLTLWRSVCGLTFDGTDVRALTRDTKGDSPAQLLLRRDICEAVAAEHFRLKVLDL